MAGDVWRWRLWAKLKEESLGSNEVRGPSFLSLCFLFVECSPTVLVAAIDFSGRCLFALDACLGREDDGDE